MNLTISNLSVSLGEKKILKNINLEVIQGKIHALMGPNGSGKSTLAASLMNNPKFLTSNNKSSRRTKILLGQKNIIKLSADERARMGLFLAFQNPVSVPGVNVASLLRIAYMTINKKKRVVQKKSIHHPALSVMDFNKLLLQAARELGISRDFLRRSLNEDFSGGEKKKLEMLQAFVLKPKIAIFDEVDTGLDVDALKLVASAIMDLKKKNTGVLLITHYLRILKYAKPDYVHILINGKIVESGTYKLAKDIEENGYTRWRNKN